MTSSKCENAGMPKEDVSDIVPKAIAAIEALLDKTAKASNAEVALQYAQAANALLSTPLGQSIGIHAGRASLPHDDRPKR
jgi:hypothetical protein